MSAAVAVLGKDLRLLWRQRAGWLSAATFAAISVLTYSFAFDLATGDVRPLLPGVLWVTFLFAGIVASGRSFAAERSRGRSMRCSWRRCRGPRCTSPRWSVTCSRCC